MYDFFQTGRASHIQGLSYVDTLKCSKRQVDKASSHQFKSYPGASLKKVSRRTRLRMPFEKRMVIASMLTCRENARSLDGGTQNSSRGLKFALLDTLPNIAAKINRELEARGLHPIDRNQLRKLMGKGFTALTEDNCCCGTCKHCGVETYKLLRDLIRQLATNSSSMR